MKRLIKKDLFVLLLIILTTTFFSCKNENKDFLPQHTYYYKFQGFDTTEVIAKTFKAILPEFLNYDYMITKSEVLLPIEKDSKIPADSASMFHQLIHRVEMFSEDEKYSDGDQMMLIKYLPGSENEGEHFHYYRFIYTKANGWELKLDLGKHPLIALPNNEKKRIRFLATEIARASFK